MTRVVAWLAEELGRVRRPAALFLASNTTATRAAQPETPAAYPLRAAAALAAEMPTVSVGRDRLFAALGRTYSKPTPPPKYDLLCLEGLARALRVFKGTEAIPVYKVASVPRDSMLKMHVKPQTSQIRPYVVCAVLRGITFDESRYNSFIDLQDKLHQNICRYSFLIPGFFGFIVAKITFNIDSDYVMEYRKRTLVAIGTHDLDTLQGPFSYEALPPQEINFVPLKQMESFRADNLIEFYKSDMKLKKFLHIIEKSPVYPVIYDSNRTVLSLPPIINGAHSAITLKTRNVFMECTATDLTKANIVLNTMVSLSDLIGPIGIPSEVMDEKEVSLVPGIFSKGLLISENDDSIVH
ncbi:hypothetical protein PR202_gb23717 [Eleusine coracana subsp. coracana]|uniref:phenylalanine--tRNA ligase n=1 Tax=Eleusine coracana subsp. coracana TaxID=191504 RepID=A0AAV5FL61_ELECO|nr:hypothetical protein PR202_gb23717 [Eleusine coracana subsp. coracana]